MKNEFLKFNKRNFEYVFNNVQLKSGNNMYFLTENNKLLSDCIAFDKNGFYNKIINSSLNFSEKNLELLKKKLF